MPVKVLFIEENEIKIEALKLCLSHNAGIKFEIIDDFKALDTALNSNVYTHLVCQSVVKNETVLAYKHLTQLPVLIINDADTDLSETSYIIEKSPLSYSALFAFLAQSTPISYADMEEYAMDDEEFFEQLKGLMVDEFKLNFEEIPALIENCNLSEIKSRAHQMSSKFSMIDMPDSWKLCKEIDMNILEDTENQLDNMKRILVDIEIALAHLR